MSQPIPGAGRAGLARLRALLQGSARLCFLPLLLAVAGCGLRGDGEDLPPPEVAEDVDLERYLGTWYEVARFEGMPFQEGCRGTTADYSLREDGRIQVVNRCVREGELAEARGVARRAEAGGSPARLEVSFFWPFWGDYWILAVEEDRYALVGSPDRDRLWMLSREPAMAPALYDRLMAWAAAQGFDISRVQRTPQPPTRGPHAP